MPEVKNLFTGARMDKDSDSRLLAPGLYRDALNFRAASSESSDAGAGENSLSNLLLTSFTLGANPVTIGMYGDEFEEKLYWFVKTDTANYVLEWDNVNSVQTVVLTDNRSGANNVLNFNENYLITGVNVLIDSDNNARYLLWTDGLNPPRQINIERAKTYAINGFSDETISVYKAPPLAPPAITLTNTITDTENNLEEKFLSFSYRYKYLDGEYSALSPFSEFAFSPKSFFFDYSTSTNESMVNNFSAVDIAFNTGSSLVTDVEIVFKESGNDNVYSVESFNKSDKGWADSSTQTFEYSNSKIKRVLNENELNRIYDNVPLVSYTQELIGNRLMYGNYKENINLLDSLGDKILVDLALSKVSTAVTSGTPAKTMKSNRDYEIGIAYLHNGGRLTTPLTSEGNTLYIKNADSINKNQLKVTVSNEAPALADSFRFFIKQSKTDYDTIIPTLFYQDGVYAWVRLDGADINKVSEGDFIYVKADTQTILENVVQTKVLEIKTQEQNFLEDPSETAIVQLAGTYMKVKPDSFNLNEGDFTNYSFKVRDTSENSDDNPIRGEINVIEPAVYYGTTGLNDLTSSGTFSGTTDTRYLIDIFTLPVFATGTVTCAGVLAGDTVTVNGLLYTAVAGAKADNTQFSIDTDDTACATDLANSISNDTRAGTSGDQSATNALGVVTITTDVIGSLGNAITLVSSNGTRLAVSGAGFLTGGKDDTFRWSTNNGSTWDDNGGNGYEITGVAQTVENGVQITFVSTTGHITDDSWVVSAKNSTDDGFGGNEGSKSYGFFKSLESNGNINIDDVIEGGAVITIRYIEYDEGTEQVIESYTSSTRYANLEEWWYGDNIQATFSIAASRIWFRRGTLTPKGASHYFTQDPTGDMVLIIKSSATQNSDADDPVKTSATLSIFQSTQNIIFETKPIDLNLDIFYEIGKTYPISNGLHLGNGASDVDQTVSTPGEFVLDVFNAFCWGNGFESYKIKDLFNSATMKMDTRASSPIEDYRENHRISSITYSGVFEQTTSVNALNEFNLSLANYKDLDDKYGKIKKLYSRDNNLLVFQEDKVLQVLFNKSVLFNADGSGNVRQTTDVLGQEIPYSGEYGISDNPESFAIYGNMVWFADSKRGAIMRLSQDGLTEVSAYGMGDYFRDSFITNPNSKKLGAYDPYFDEYVLSLQDDAPALSETLSFDDALNGWVSFHSFVPDWMSKINNRFFTVKNGQLYLHNDSDNPVRNNFYGTQYDTTLTYIINNDPSIIKVAKTINLESNKAFDVLIKSYLNDETSSITQSTIDVSEFVNKEGKWYGYVRGNEIAGDTSAKNVYGLGRVASVLGSVITLTTSLPKALISVGDTLVNSSLTTIGTIVSYTDTTITVDTTPSLAGGTFMAGVKNGRIEGSEIRGYNFEVKLTDSTTTRTELYAASSEMFRSEPS